MKRAIGMVMVLVVGFSALLAQGAEVPGKWPADKAEAWGKAQPWYVGCNYGPAYAINQLEMWQADTFDLKAIDKELQLAEDLGFNSLRVFLHHMLWDQDSKGFLNRMDEFLKVCEKHKIGVMFVLFDSVWDPHPRLGPQRAPRPHLHNSGWLQSPGIEILRDPKRHDEMEAYVKGVVGRFRNDKRVQCWDIINEPDNTNGSSYSYYEPANKEALSITLMTKAFAWAREMHPTQPLTSGMWIGAEWDNLEKVRPIDRAQIELSDVISFHSYDKMPELQRRVEALKKHGRPILCTEYMARPNGSTFDPHLGYMKEQKVAAYNWGFVAGKTQTQYPWDSWRKNYTEEPPVWFHEIFKADHTPYRPEEVEYIRKVTGKK